MRLIPGEPDGISRSMLFAATPTAAMASMLFAATPTAAMASLAYPMRPDIIYKTIMIDEFCDRVPTPTPSRRVRVPTPTPSRICTHRTEETCSSRISLFITPAGSFRGLRSTEDG